MIPTIEDIVAGLLAGTYTKEQAIAWLKQHATNEAEWWYDEDGESGGDWASCAEYADLIPGRFMKVHGAAEVCTKYVANVIKSVHDDGEADETEYELFNSKEEAEKACADLPAKASATQAITTQANGGE